MRAWRACTARDGWVLRVVPTDGKTLGLLRASEPVETGAATLEAGVNVRLGGEAAIDRDQETVACVRRLRALMAAMATLPLAGKAAWLSCRALTDGP